VTGIFPYPSGGQVGEQDAPIAHEFDEVQTRTLLADNVAHHRVGYEGAELVEGRRHGFALQGLGVARVLLGPELRDNRITDRRGDLLPQPLIGQEPVEEQKRGPRIRRDREDRVAQNVLEPRAPGVGPVLAKDRDELGCQESSVRVRLSSPTEDVERQRKLPVLRSEQQDLVGPAPRDKREHAVDQIAVRVEESEAGAGRQILGHEIGEERGLARAGLAEEPEVAEPIIGKEPKPEMLAPPGRLPEDE